MRTDYAGLDHDYNNNAASIAEEPLVGLPPKLQYFFEQLLELGVSLETAREVAFIQDSLAAHVERNRSNGKLNKDVVDPTIRNNIKKLVRRGIVEVIREPGKKGRSTEKIKLTDLAIHLELI